MYQRTVTFGEAITMGFNKLLTFSGRSSRSEFWWWYLFTYIIFQIISWAALTIFGINAALLLDASSDASQVLFGALGIGGTFALCVISILQIIAWLPISIRRLHDTGRGGGWIFISLIPLIGWIWYLILLLLPSQLTDNRFGPIPNLQKQGW